MGVKKKLRIGLASAKRLPFEGPGSDALKRAASRSVKQACPRTIQRPALILVAQGASPSMREREGLTGYYDALFGDKLQALTKKAVG